MSAPPDPELQRIASMTRFRLPLPFWMNVANIEAIAQQRGWRFVEARPADNVAEETVWMLPDQQTYINYVVDFGLQLHYLVVQGAQAEPLVETLAEQLPVITREEVFEMAREAVDRDGHIGAIYHAAILTREDREDPELLALFERYFAHSDSEVRRAAVFASTYAGWRSFEAPLRRLAMNDEVEDVRAIAEATLESLEQHVWKNG